MKNGRPCPETGRPQARHIEEAEDAEAVARRLRKV